MCFEPTYTIRDCDTYFEVECFIDGDKVDVYRCAYRNEAVKYGEAFLQEERDYYQEPEQFRDDAEADANALASAGYGTDEDYGYYGD